MMERVCTHVVAVTLLAVSVLASLTVSDALPDLIVSHWNTQGQADGFASKFVMLYGFPVFIALMYLLFIGLPHIDPLKKNFKDYRRDYDRVVLVIVAFFVYMQLLILGYNVGFDVSMNQWMPPGLSVLFIVIGYSLKNAKRNWFMGIRTPWTLSSDTVWKKTHNVASILFIISGVIMLFGVLYPDSFLQLVLGPVLTSTIGSVVYSYFAFKAEKKKKGWW